METSTTPETHNTEKVLGPEKVQRPSRWQLLHTTRFMRVARFTTFVGALTAVGAGIGYTRVRGQMADQLMSVGESLMRYENADRQDGARAFQMNGQVVQLSSGSTSDNFETVLDQFEERCRMSNATLQAQVNEATDGDHFVVREQGSEAGVVACLEFGGEITLSELVARGERFRETNDLHDLGDVRYVYTRETASGGTHFVTFWTEGSFDFDEITGHGGNQDVPGSEHADIPRPPGSRRMLDATESGVDQHVRMYTGSSMTEWELEAFYRESLQQSGYRVLIPSEDRLAGPGTFILAERDGRETFVVLGMDERGLGQATILAGN